jgi:hypothetical protein
MSSDAMGRCSSRIKIHHLRRTHWPDACSHNDDCRTAGLAPGIHISPLGTHTIRGAGHPLLATWPHLPCMRTNVVDPVHRQPGTTTSIVMTEKQSYSKTLPIAATVATTLVDPPLGTGGTWL